VFEQKGAEMSNMNPIDMDRVATQIYEDMLKKAAQERLAMELTSARKSRKRRKSLGLSQLFSR
jgi:hypothetical protein